MEKRNSQHGGAGRRLLFDLKSPRGSGETGERNREHQGKRSKASALGRVGDTLAGQKKEPFVHNRQTGRCLTGDPRCATSRRGGGGERVMSEEEGDGG